jgi:hypothetical protein
MATWSINLAPKKVYEHETVADDSFTTGLMAP